MALVDWIKLLSDLSEIEKENLSLFCQEKHLKAGEVLFYEQDEATAMYLLKEWKIEISRNKDWEKVVLWDVAAEEILWEMALFWDTNKRMATATAIEDCVLIVVLSFSIKELTNKHPHLFEKIKMIINDRDIMNKSKM